MMLDRLVLPQIRPGPFTKHFNKSVKKMEDMIHDYLIDPNAENIHDVRTSIRRFDASFRLLPKGIRNKPNFLKGRDSYRSLFKINSEIRDMDIMRAKFTHYPRDVTSNYSDFLETVQDRRNKKLRQAKEIALSAYNLEPLRIKKGTISMKDLRGRYLKLTARFVNEIEHLFPLVVSDIEKQAELHELRKDCKKLRYILEATEPSGESSVESVIGLLEGMQDILGAIHDSDIMLLHLARAKGGIHARRMNDFGDGKGDYSDLIDLEQKERVKLYYQFVSKYGSAPMKQHDGFSSKNEETASNKAEVP